MSKHKHPAVLVYRRTHTGDPSSDGVFGCHDCMGSMRTWNYNAAIGIGAEKPWPGEEGIARRITWIGTGPFGGPICGRAPLVGFENFKLWDADGPLLADVAPQLHAYMFEQGRVPRAGLISRHRKYPAGLYEEVVDLLGLVHDAPRSQLDYYGGTPQLSNEPKAHIEKNSRGCR